MLSTIVSRYFLIAAIFFIVNFARFAQCFIYQAVYNNNFEKSTPNKNYFIRHFVVSLLSKTNTPLQFPAIDIIADADFRKDFNSAFENAKGYFFYNMLCSIGWPLIIAKKFLIFLPVTKVRNKLFSILFAIIEAFAVYLLGLFLDTTGIGGKILTYLLDTANDLFARISAHFH